MRKTLKPLYILAFFLTAILPLSSCGNSVLGEETFAPTDIVGRLRIASTNAEYSSIATDAGVVCVNAENTYSSETASAHCGYQSEALSILSGVDPIGILSDLTALAGGNSGATNIYEQLNVPAENAANIFQAAAAINGVATANLTTSQQIQKATVNTYSIIALFQLRYVIDHNGLHNRLVPFDIEGAATTYTTGYESSKTGPNQDPCGTSRCREFENLNFVADGLEDNGYISNASDAFQNADVLSDTQSEQTDDLDEEAQAFVNLRTAVIAANPAYEIGDETFNFNTTVLATLESQIHDALDAIMGTN